MESTVGLPSLPDPHHVSRRVRIEGAPALPPAASAYLGARLPYDSLAQLRQALFAAHPHLQRIGTVTPGDGADLRRLAQLPGAPDKTPFASVIEDFYLTNPIARASAVMAECSALAEQRTMTAAE